MLDELLVTMSGKAYALLNSVQRGINQVLAAQLLVDMLRCSINHTQTLTNV